MASVGKVAAFAAMLRVLIVAPAATGATTGGRRSGRSPSSRWSSARCSRSCRPTSSGCWPTRRSATPASSSSASRRRAHAPGQPGEGLGIPSSLLYLLLYAVLVLGTFAVVTAGRSHRRRADRSRRRSAGSAQAKPALALAMTVLLLAQAGVPLTSGFIAKFGVIQAAVEEHSYAIAIIAMVVVGHRRVPVPADHGQHVDHRARGRRRRPRGGPRAVRDRPWPSRSPSASPSSSASCPAGWSKPRSTPRC